jgi:regulator of PEP synthase PpsR (kinase-PPPase family)
VVLLTGVAMVLTEPKEQAVRRIKKRVSRAVVMLTIRQERREMIRRQRERLLRQQHAKTYMSSHSKQRPKEITIGGGKGKLIQ